MTLWFCITLAASLAAVGVGFGIVLYVARRLGF